MALLLGLGPGTSFTLVTVAPAVTGAGLGLVNPPITNTGVSGMPPAQAGDRDKPWEVRQHRRSAGAAFADQAHLRGAWRQQGVVPPPARIQTPPGKRTRDS
jgi:hypothetical protein